MRAGPSLVRAWYGAAVLLALVTAAGSSLPAEARVLDRLEVREGEASSRIVIHLNTPASYVSHAPATRGDFIRIEVRPTSAAGGGNNPTGREETLTWSPSVAVPLDKVTYDQVAPDSATLTLSFTRAVSYRVRSGSDFRSFVITVSGAAARKPAGAAATATPEPMADRAGRPGGDAISGAAQNGANAPTGVQSPGPTVAAARRPEVDVSFPYAINLMSSRTPIDRAEIPDLEAFRSHRLYVTQFTKDGQVWNRLRLGFFADTKAASRVRRELATAFPDAWIVKTSPTERKRSADLALSIGGRALAAGPPSQPAKAPAPAQAAPARSAADLRKAEDLAAEARTAMTAGDLRRAIQLYTKILRDPGDPHAQEAQELLGLARERNGQLAHAKAEYETYLRLYPEGEGAERVRQRLAGLLTARAEPKESAGREPDQVAGAAEDLDWDLSGSWSQFFFHDENFADPEGRTATRTDLDSDLDVSARVRGSRLEGGARFAGSNTQDFEESDNDSRIRTLYVEALDSQLEIFTRLGRQNRSSGGVLGRFDGGLISYQATPKVNANVVGGFPVDSTDELEPEPDRHFAGISLDLGTFYDRWDGNVFFINQIADGFTDRRAVGGEVRYFDANTSVFSLVDYDVLFQELNIALLNGTYVFEDRTTVNMALDYRNSPLLTTSNAIQGQGVSSLDALRDAFTEGELRDLARDRTATSKSVTVGASHPLNTTYQVSADVTASELSSTETSGGVEGFEGTGIEYFYSAQLIGSGVVKDGDLAVVGLRYSDLSTSDRFTVDLNTRYPMDRSFRFNARLRTDYRTNKDDDGTRFSIRPSIRLDYIWDRDLSFELDLGGQWNRETQSGFSEDSIDLFAIAGYRFDF